MIIAIPGIIGTMDVTNLMVTHASSDDDDDENNKDPLNEVCYRSGFNDGEQSKAYNQTAFSQCGVNDRDYYEGFISGCIVGHGMECFACTQKAK